MSSKSDSSLHPTVDSSSDTPDTNPGFNASQSDQGQYLNGPISDFPEENTQKITIYQFIAGKWFSSKRFQILSPFIPLSTIAFLLHWPPIVIFTTSCFAAMIIRRLMKSSAEQTSRSVKEISRRIIWSDTSRRTPTDISHEESEPLFKSSLGRLAQLCDVLAKLFLELSLVGMHTIFALDALWDGDPELSKTFTVGAILVNILFAIGLAFIMYDMKRNERKARKQKTTNSTFMDQKKANTQASVSLCLLSLACTTLVIPAAYEATTNSDASGKGLLLMSRGTAILLLLVFVTFLYSQIGIKDGNHLEREDDPLSMSSNETDEAVLTVASSIFLLCITLALGFIYAYFVISSLHATAAWAGFPDFFFGLIVVPLLIKVVDVFEIFNSRNPMDLVKTYLRGAIQLSLLSFPLLVIISWISGHEFTLLFPKFEIIVLSVSVILVHYLTMDGKGNYMEGLMLLVLYVVIAISAAVW